MPQKTQRNAIYFCTLRWNPKYQPWIQTRQLGCKIGLILACEQAPGEIFINFCALRLAFLAEIFFRIRSGLVRRLVYFHTLHYRIELEFLCKLSLES